MQNRYKPGLNQKIVVGMMLAFLAVFALCFASFAVILDHRVKSETRREIEECFSRIGNRIQGYISETDLASNTVMCSSWVQQLYAGYYLDSATQAHANQSNAERFLSSFASMYGELDCFIILGDGSYIKNNSSYLIDPAYRLEEQALELTGMLGRMYRYEQ